MTAKEESSIGIYNYGCLNCNSKLQCKTCDGFGRNPSIDVRIERCYITKEQMKDDLDLNKKARID